MPAPTRSAGIWPTTTPRRCRGRRSTGSWSGPARSPRTRRNAQELLHPVRSRPAERELAVRLHPLPARSTAPTTEILTWLDDCSRYALSVTAHARVTGPVVLAHLPQNRCHLWRSGLHADRQRDGVHHPLLRRQGRPQPPRTRTTRTATSPRRTASPTIRRPKARSNAFQQTLKKWLRAQPDQPATVAELQALLDAFVELYNHHRPHRSLPHHATPATIYTSLPKATPSTDRSTDTHDRVRRDKIDKAGSVTLRVAGQLRHIGVGRTYARTDVILLVQDLHVTIINAATGEILRDLTIDPRRDYQPTGRPPGPNPKKIARTCKTQVRAIPMSRDITWCPRQDSNLRPST